jgi:hypothetical protein
MRAAGRGSPFDRAIRRAELREIPRNATLRNGLQTLTMQV